MYVARYAGEIGGSLGIHGRSNTIQQIANKNKWLLRPRVHTIQICGSRLQPPHPTLYISYWQIKALLMLAPSVVTPQNQYFPANSERMSVQCTAYTASSRECTDTFTASHRWSKCDNWNKYPTILVRSQKNLPHWRGPWWVIENIPICNLSQYSEIVVNLSHLHWSLIAINIPTLVRSQ